MSSILVDKVSFSYPNTPILADACFKVDPFEFVGIIGPNGGGKSTLLKLLLGFLKPATGLIEINGKAPKSNYPHIGYVPQTLGFDKQFPISVIEVVLSGCISHLSSIGFYKADQKNQAYEALKQVGLEAFHEKPFGNLSGGQMQRVLIARALATHPTLLLLDEPTASIDPQGEKEIFSILKNLRKSMTILMVTHDLNAAIQEVDRLLLVQGTVIPLTLKEVCEHFAMGLYHAPLIQPNHLIHLGKK